MLKLLALVSLLLGSFVATQSAAAAASAPAVFTRASAGADLLPWIYGGAQTDAVLVLYDNAGKPVARYHLEMAWPSKVQGPSFDASKNEISIETLEISHEGMSLVTDNKDDSGGYRASAITGTVSFAGRTARGALFVCAQRDC